MSKGGLVVRKNLSEKRQFFFVGVFLGVFFSLGLFFFFFFFLVGSFLGALLVFRGGGRFLRTEGFLLCGWAFFWLVCFVVAFFLLLGSGLFLQS